jgi:ATP-binding cassette subfamily B (MDR/TAP) protein 1
MHIVQFDIRTTFLHGDQDEEIYLLQPEGFTSSGQELKDCRLQKSLYGLKQSSRVWNRKFNDFLTKFNLHPTEVNPYVYSTKEKPLLIMTIFVDDGLGCCVQNSKLDKMINHLEQVFEVSKSYADVYVRFTHLT